MPLTTSKKRHRLYITAGVAEDERAAAWRPFQLRIKGKGERSVYSEYKVYSYLDARRWANLRGGLVLRPRHERAGERTGPHGR